MVTSLVPWNLSTCDYVLQFLTFPDGSTVHAMGSRNVTLAIGSGRRKRRREEQNLIFRAAIGSDLRKVSEDDDTMTVPQNKRLCCGAS